MNLLQLLCLSFVIVLCFGEERGDGCKQNNGLNGKCELLYDCLSAMSDLERGIKPKICGFDDKIPVVCCTERIFRINKSAQKCYEYAKLTLQSRFKSTDFNLNVMQAIGGTLSATQEFPHMAALGYGDKNKPTWMCGGSLISDRYILTAAHCLVSKEMGEVKWIRLGDLNLYTSVDDAKPEDFQIEEKIKHPGYMPPSRYNDIALLKLNRKVEFNSYIYPACLYYNYNISTNILTAIGWGLTEEFGSPSDHLVKVDLDLYTDEECMKRYRPERTLAKGVLPENQFCAGGKTIERGTCSGDSGGPIQIKTDNIRNLYSVVGITSFGRGCAVLNTAGVYTRVSRYLPWIESIVWPDK